MQNSRASFIIDHHSTGRGLFLGILALDIDGTVTGKTHAMPEEVERYLAEQVRLGWEIVFITGRTFAYGQEVLDNCQWNHLVPKAHHRLPLNVLDAVARDRGDLNDRLQRYGVCTAADTGQHGRDDRERERKADR